MKVLPSVEATGLQEEPPRERVFFSGTQQEALLLQTAESFTETVNMLTWGFPGPANVKAVF